MWEKLKSRKFQAVIGGILIALGSALTGKIEFGNAITSIVILILAYLGVEGLIDYARMKWSLPRAEKPE